MVSPPVFEVEALLAPIPGGSPAGTNLRDDHGPSSAYYSIKDARTAARNAERQSVDAQSARPDWTPVLEMAPRLLRERSKDLEIAAWFIEALLRKQGFAGLRDGLRLVNGLVERYWDGLHPMPDEDGMTTRVAALAGLNGIGADGALLAPIAMVDITQGKTNGAFSSWHYDRAQALEKITDPEVRAARTSAADTTLEKFQVSFAETAPAFYVDLVADLRACLEEFDKVTKSLDKRCGPAAPPSSSLKRALTTVLDKVLFVAKDVLAQAGAAEAKAPAAGDGSAENGSPPGARAGAGGPLRSREEAFHALEQVALFFRKTEPHSPLPYLLERCVRWGRLPLHELVGELIVDPNARASYCQLIGVQQQPQQQKGKN